MPSFTSSREAPYSPAQMFDLVADVDAYPEFLPLCTGMRVLKRTSDEQGVETVIAEMRVGYKAIRETFTSRVSLDRRRLTIEATYVDGPFRHLENRWTFHDLSKDGAPSCRIDFAIEYEFRNRALAALMGVMFDAAFRRFSQAFEERAVRVYGKSGRPTAAADAS